MRQEYEKNYRSIFQVCELRIQYSFHFYALCLQSYIYRTNSKLCKTYIKKKKKEKCYRIRFIFPIDRVITKIVLHEKGQFILVAC